MTPPTVGNTEPSQIHKLGISQLQQSALTTLVRGSLPMRAVLYQCLQDFDELKDMVRNEQGEHEQANADLSELMTLDPGNAAWLDKLKSITQAIVYHIENEEGKLFPLAKELLDDEAMRMAERRAQHLRAITGGAQ